MNDPRLVMTQPTVSWADVQNVLGRLDKIVARFEHRQEGLWHTEVFEDIAFTGNELLGATVFAARNCGFKARSIIAYNTSKHDVSLSGGIVIPAVSSEFVARVKPPRDIFSASIKNAGTTAGTMLIYLTEELLMPTVGTL